MTNPAMGDREYLTDSLNLQKYITESYNNFANECTDPNLRNGFLTLLKDEHMIQAELFDELNNRGWYQPKQANPTEITQALQKYTTEAH